VELTILIAVVIMLLFAAAVLYLVFFRRKEGAAAPRTPRISIENRSATLKAANRRLSQNPKDPNALQNLATIYYTEGDFEKAYKYFDTLVGLCATHPELDEADITLKRAICAKNMGDNSQAHKDLLVAKGLSPDGFEVNFHLGHMEFKKKSYEKASALLALARKRQPDHIQTLRYLGLRLFRIRRFDQAIKRCETRSPTSRTTRKPHSRSASATSRWAGTRRPGRSSHGCGRTRGSAPTRACSPGRST